MITAAFLATAMAFVPDFAGIALPIQEEFDLSIDEASGLQYYPELAGLLLVFVAAALAIRWGRRVVMVSAAMSFTLGALLVSLAPGVGVLVFALALVGMGSVTLTVVGLSLINVTFTTTQSRGRAFGVVAALSPLLALVIPNLSATLSENLGWRMVPLIWACGGAATAVFALLGAPARETKPVVGEMVTPALAGLALASFCFMSSTLASPNALTLVSLAVCLASVGVVVVLMRYQSTAGLDLRILKTRSGIRAASAVVLIWCVGLTFYISIFLQFRYDYGVAAATAVITVTEVAGIAGSLAFGALAGRWGAQRAALIAVGSAGMLCLILALASGTDKPWLIVALTALVAFPSSGSIGPVTEFLLNHAPEDGSDGGSAVADAASNVGFVAGGALLSIIIFSGFTHSLTTEIQSRGYDAIRSGSIAQDIRNGTSSEDIVAREEATDPRIRDVLISDAATINSAQAAGLRIMGVSFAVVFVAAGLLILPGIRRRGSLHVVPPVSQPDRSAPQTS